MKREIKFRAWDGHSMAHFRIGSDNPLASEVNLSWIKDQTLMQYTGLKDKNGMDIYEGDVVRDRHQGAIYLHERTTVAAYGELLGGFGVGFNLNSKDELEVIGNLCQNPELLESK